MMPRVRLGRGYRELLRRSLPGAATRTKYGSRWTRYAGHGLHTTVRDCPLQDPVRCPICSTRTPEASQFWYPSRAEAFYARQLDWQLNAGQIRGWRRSRSVLLVEGPARGDRVRYVPDFDVWTTSDPEGYTAQPDERIEVKGSRNTIADDALVKIKAYRAAVRRGEQPPLRIMSVVADRVSELRF